ncbi:hypothetical protein BX616_006750 [Lobosporangium transversale]|uniref:Uncharacterized protein n=1 Tax=Lobosporangium transversale TaxID=64571 RepID=A0A1Y2GTQ6_9FUNG|nr:hypothetical protein BCR41DRAFT_394425 [Lobosporangium transversale]KAF9896789.1 hypothetical protein BX616_006750 [Lobosporangium transversale]ORZ22858.1 hypothetical protein BCR41DRAFT_394425 [Lobosporangium transversale]|eukprot:XP_021883412.1 hypothetical protein BCR41DRAFT_394425 [Lobosporangium transversale]
MAVRSSWLTPRLVTSLFDSIVSDNRLDRTGAFSASIFQAYSIEHIDAFRKYPGSRAYHNVWPAGVFSAGVISGIDSDPDGGGESIEMLAKGDDDSNTHDDHARNQLNQEDCKSLIYEGADSQEYNKVEDVSMQSVEMNGSDGTDLNVSHGRHGSLGGCGH